jgi:hypothetical protein
MGFEAVGLLIVLEPLYSRHTYLNDRNRELVGECQFPPEPFLLKCGSLNLWRTPWHKEGSRAIHPQPCRRPL